MGNRIRMIAITIYLVSLLEVVFFNLSKIKIINENIATYIYEFAVECYGLNKLIYDIRLSLILLIVLSLITVITIESMRVLARNHYEQLIDFLKKILNRYIKQQIKFTSNSLGKKDRKWVSVIISYIAIMFLVINVISIRFIYFNDPQGYDTLSYVYYAERLLENPISNFLTVLYPIPTLISALIFVGTNNNIVLTGILLPYVFGVISALLLYTAYRIIFPKEIAFMATTLYVMSYTFIRLTYDLYGHLMAVSVLAFVLIPMSDAVISILKHGTMKFNRKVTEIIVSLAILFLVHAPTFVTFISFLITIFVIFKIAGKTSITVGEQDASRSYRIIIIIIVIALIIAGSIYVSCRIQSYINLINNMIREFNILQPEISPKYFWPLMKETTIYLFLTIIGCWALLFTTRNTKERTYMILNVSWFTYLVVIFILILGYQQGYRILLYNPFPLVISYGIQKGENLETRIALPQIDFITKHIKNSWSIILVLFLLFGSLTASRTIINGYIKEYRYFNQEYYEKLLEVRNEFGFNNKTIEVIIHKEKFRDVSRYLAYAVIGENVYFGTIKEFLEHLQQTKTYYQNLKYLILIKELINSQIEEDYLRYAQKINQDIYMISLENIINEN